MRHNISFGTSESGNWLEVSKASRSTHNNVSLLHLFEVGHMRSRFKNWIQSCLNEIGKKHGRDLWCSCRAAGFKYWIWTVAFMVAREKNATNILPCALRLGYRPRQLHIFFTPEAVVKADYVDRWSFSNHFESDVQRSQFAMSSRWHGKKVH